MYFLKQKSLVIKKIKLTWTAPIFPRRTALAINVLSVLNKNIWPTVKMGIFSEAQTTENATA